MASASSRAGPGGRRNLRPKTHAGSAADRLRTSTPAALGRQPALLERGLLDRDDIKGRARRKAAQPPLARADQIEQLAMAMGLRRDDGGEPDGVGVVGAAVGLPNEVVEPILSRAGGVVRVRREPVEQQELGAGLIGQASEDVGRDHVRLSRYAR